MAQKNSLNVSVIQMCSLDEPNENIEQALYWMGQAAEDASGNGHSLDLIVLPENFLCFGNKGLSTLRAKREDYLKRLSQFCRLHRVSLVAGSIPHEEDANLERSKYFSRSLCLDANGQCVAHYDKVHLFDVDVADGHGAYRESDTYVAGDRLSVTSLAGVTLGQSICYDLRFPYLYEGLRAAGAQLISVPAAFTAVTGAAHWEILLRARAIESQCYVLAANQSGDHGKGRTTWGHSMIVDPWGRILAECRQEGPGFASTSLDLSAQDEIRQSIPVVQHKKQL